MQATDIRGLVARHLEAEAAHDGQRAASYYAPDGYYENVPLGLRFAGRDAVAFQYDASYAAMPDGAVAIDGEVVDETGLVHWGDAARPSERPVPRLSAHRPSGGAAVHGALRRARRAHPRRDALLGPGDVLRSDRAPAQRRAGGGWRDAVRCSASVALTRARHSERGGRRAGGHSVFRSRQRTGDRLPARLARQRQPVAQG